MFKTLNSTKIRCVLITAILIGSITLAKAQKIEILQQGKPTSIRGLSVVNNKTAWISGSKGHVAITNDAGLTWNWQQVKGYETADFRDIEAFSDKEAIIMSSGTPALILKTTDGGATWDLKYKNDDKAYFLDAMDFANNKHGFILGDPINNKFLLLETTDAGNTWHPFTVQPDAMPGEAAFAASGTCLRVDSKGNMAIVTGGAVARHIALSSKNKLTVTDLPITHGPSSNGAFSLSADGVLIVGGNYSKDKITDSVSCRLNSDTPVGYRLNSNGIAGYQSCIENINNILVYLSTGTPGSNISTDGGTSWVQIDKVSFNVCRKAKKGNLVLLAGDKGKIGVLKF